MISKTTFCMLLASMVLCVSAFGQTGYKSITGTVLDDQQEPVAGATVVVKGTSLGTAAGTDGAFRLNVPEKGTLVISCPGFTDREVEISMTSVYNIVMEGDTRSMDEIVVVGYGTMRKKDLTGSVVQIIPDKLAVENPATIQDLLRNTPGLQVGYDASAKGGGSLQIRGQRSVYTEGNHNSPLLILDGMPFYGELSEINPDDIGQIDILKDASAAAIYGSKSANGVIIVTTKVGKKGKPVVNFTANFGLSEQVSNRARFTPSQYLQHRADWYETATYGVNTDNGAWEAYQTDRFTQPGYFRNPSRLRGVSVDDWRGYSVNDPEESDASIWGRRLGLLGNLMDNYLSGKTIDWEDKAFRLGFNQDYNASVSGAGERANYYLSMGYLDNQGVKIDDGYSAIRANMKVNFDVNKWLTLGANVNFQDRSDKNSDRQMNLGGMLQNSPYADYADENGNPIQYPLNNSVSSSIADRGYNWDFVKQYMEIERGYTVLNTILNAKLTLPFNITYTFNASPRYQFFYDREFLSADLPDSTPTSRGVDRSSNKRFDWSLNNTLNWDYTFAGKHHIILTLVQEAEERQYWSDNISARNIQPSDALGFHNTQNGTKENSEFSTNDTHETADALLARLFYSYDDRYAITASIRRDGYSAFGTSNPRASFPSVAVAWTFSNEKFFEPLRTAMDYGKLRVSYGKNGNRSLSSPYLALANLSAGGGAMQGYINSAGNQDLYRYLMVSRMANPNLQWEKTTSWNIGLDFGFLGNRLTGSIEYYRMQTKDMIMNRRVTEFTGFSSITTNLGQVDNNGIEITLESLNIDNRNFRWSTTLGFAYNRNVIRHLYYDYENGREQDDVTNGWFIGQPISAIWNYRVDGIWQKHEWEEAAKYKQVPGDPKVANLYTADDIDNGDGTFTPVYNNNDKVFLGQESAPFRWSLRNEFTFWRDLSFSFSLYSYMGHSSLSTNYLNADDTNQTLSKSLVNIPAKEYWTVDNPSDKYGRIGALGPTGATSPNQIYSRSFIRLENVSIGYSLPRSWVKTIQLEKVKVYGSVRNAGNWTREWEYGDPETANWASRVWTLGINITF